MKAKERSIKVWVAREYADYADYRIFASRKPHFDSGKWFSHKSDVARATLSTPVCAKHFERAAPKKLHLKPGGGPVRAEIVIGVPVKKRSK